MRSTYKNILLRMKANMEADPAIRQALVAEADALRNRAMELAEEPARRGRADMAFVPAPGQPPPPPPPPPPPVELIDGQAPVRVGGNIKPPTKTRDVKPVYPEEALASRVQGVVIIEATIDTLGNVSTARVLRGQPLLDQAALDAVKEWQFTPTMLNGVAVPVIMTVTVNFTMDRDRGRRFTADLGVLGPPPPAASTAGAARRRPGAGAGRREHEAADEDSVTSSRSTRLTRWPTNVQGVVILEATIDPARQRSERARAPRSAAARPGRRRCRQQWQYQPTLLNGVAVPVIMTVTVNFTLDR